MNREGHQPLRQRSNIGGFSGDEKGNSLSPRKNGRYHWDGTLLINPVYTLYWGAPWEIRQLGALHPKGQGYHLFGISFGVIRNEIYHLQIDKLTP